MSSSSEPSAGQSDASASSHAPAKVVDPQVAAAQNRHWQANMRLTLGLLVVWAAVSLGCGVLLADVLNDYTFLGFPLGFWFAQQGAIITFVLLILIYALVLARLDRRLKAELRQIAAKENAS